jgi:hypothetical protein
MAEPTILKGGQNASVTYEIVTPYGLYADDVLNELQARVPRARELDWMRQLSGGDRMIPKRLAKQHKVSHFEDGEWFSASVTAAVVDNAVANKTTITLSAGDHWDSGKNSYPKVTQLALFSNQAVGYVESINKSGDNAHTVTIKRLNSDQDVQTPSVVGATVVFVTNAQAGGSGKIGSHVPRFERVDNYLHTFREDIELEDHEMQNETWFEFKGEKKVYLKALDEVADKFAMQETLGLLVTPQASGITAASNKEVRTANGLIPQIKANGINTEYFSAPTMTTLEDMELLLDKWYGDSENLVAMGINAEQGLRHWLLEFTKGDSRGLTFAGEDKQSVGINFTSAKLGSRVYHFDTWKVLSHYQSLGAAGFPYRDMMIGIPLGGGNVYSSAGGEKEWRRYFRIAYNPSPTRAKNKIVDDVYIWDDGGLASTPTNDVATLGVHMMSYKTLELSCLNKFFLITKG